MTHSGGKDHAVGDCGQRYEVTVFDERENRRVVLGWAEEASTAARMATTAEAKPSWKFAWVTDRQAAATAPKPAVKEGCCELCGEPMPPGESMFKFHGYSGPCPTPSGADAP